MNKNQSSSRTFTLIRFLSLLSIISCSQATENGNHLQSATDVRQTEQEPKVKETAILTYPTLDSDERAMEFLLGYEPKSSSNKIQVETSYGNITIELFSNTPLHRKNILYLTDRKYFDGTWFHRVSAGHVVQAGNNDEQALVQLRKEIGNYHLSPEAIGENYHVYGSVAIARSYKNNPNKLSDPYEFYICLGQKYSLAQLQAMEEQYGIQFNKEQLQLYQEQGGSPHLDGEHTVFGKVIEGMDVLEEISEVEVDEGEWPLEIIEIKVRNL